VLGIGCIIIYMETKFRPNRRIFVFGGHFIPWLPWQRPPFWIFSTPPPKAATYYGGFSYKVDHNMAPKPWRFAMVLGIGWNFPEILSDMCTHNLEA
jgi:hypothetical protein